MSQIERLSNISLAEEPNFQANVSAPVKKVRSKGKNYTKDITYQTVEEAKEVLNKEKTWSFLKKGDIKAGKKLIYRCATPKYRGQQCIMRHIMRRRRNSK
jgi:hypothetical protein